MFARLLKYDLRAVAKVWWIAAVSILGISVAGGLGLADVILHSEDVNYFSMGIFGVILTYMAMVAFIIITEVLLFIRYYKNFFSDEGYLTFTLPVKRTQLYWSKTLNAMIWMLATFAVLFVCIAEVLYICPDVTETAPNLLIYVLQILGELLKSAFESVGLWLVIWAAEVLVLILLGTMVSVCLIQLCITVGSMLVKRAKVLVAIGLAYGISGIYSTVYFVLSFFFPTWMMITDGLYPNAFTGEKLYLLVTLGLFLMCVIVAMLCAVICSATLSSLERKLNLA